MHRDLTEPELISFYTSCSNKQEAFDLIWSQLYHEAVEKDKTGCTIDDLRDEIIIYNEKWEIIWMTLLAIDELKNPALVDETVDRTNAFKDYVLMKNPILYRQVWGRR